MFLVTMLQFLIFKLNNLYVASVKSVFKGDTLQKLTQGGLFKKKWVEIISQITLSQSLCGGHTYVHQNMLILHFYCIYFLIT